MNKWKIWPIIFLILLFWLFLPKRRKEVLQNGCMGLVKKCNFKNIAKFGFIGFSLIKLMISLYIISLMIIGSHPAYALGLALMLFIVIALIVYKIWGFSSNWQQGIFRFLGILLFGLLIVLFGGMVSIFLFKLKPDVLFDLKQSLVSNFWPRIWAVINFNLKYALLSTLMIWFLALPLIKYLRIENFERKENFKHLINFFDFWYYIPGIFYAVNAFFICHLFNWKIGQWSALIVLVLNTYLFYLPKLIQKYLINKDCLSLLLLPSNKINLNRNFRGGILLFGQIFLDLELILPFALLNLGGLNIAAQHELFSLILEKVLQSLNIVQNAFNVQAGQIVLWIGFVLSVLWVLIFILKKRLAPTN